MKLKQFFFIKLNNIIKLVNFKAVTKKIYIQNYVI